MIVAAMLSGVGRVWDAVAIDLEEENDIGFDNNLRLWSLLETLVMWRNHALGQVPGTLRSYIPVIDKTHKTVDDMLDTIYAMLIGVQMAEELYEYGDGEDMQMFAGWTKAELKQIAAKYQPSIESAKNRAKEE